MISIQKAGASAIPQIQQLVDIIWPATYNHILPAGQANYMLQLLYTPAALQQQMNEGLQFIIAFEKEIAVGFAAYAPVAASVDSFKLHKLYILPNQQGKGIGKKLINYVIDAMRPATLLRLNVNRHNPARSFYEKLGFVIIDSVDIPIGEGYCMNDYIMQLTVNTPTGASV